jgi:uroporphyrinogen-III synthase
MILITRPEQDAQELSRILRDKKIESCIDPCISFDLLSNYENKLNNKLFLISSKQAFFALQKNKNLDKNFFVDNQFFIIGSKVAELCKNEGAKKIIEIFQNFSSFSKYISQNSIKDQINYMCGNIISEEAEEFINKFVLKKIIVYKTIPSKKFKKQTMKLIEENKISFVLIYSKFTATIFNQLIESHNLKDKAVNLKYICISERVAQYMKTLNYKLSISTDRPEQSAIVRLIEGVIHNKINNL